MHVSLNVVLVNSDVDENSSGLTGCKKLSSDFTKILPSSSIGATTLGGFWHALRFPPTIFYLSTSLSNFSLSSSLNLFVTSFSHSSFLLPFSYHNPFHTLVVLFYTYQNYSLEPSQECRFLQGAVASRTPNPLPQRTGVSLLVWAITFDLSDTEGPASSYATAGIALRII